MKELIIHFIGLALFSTAVPNDPGIRVLLPRVVHQHTTTATTQPTEGGEIIVNPDTTNEVEPHETLIVYDASDFREEILWTSLELPAHLIRAGTTNPARYRYVPLGDGERVSFHTNVSDNPRVSIPSLPKPSCGTGIDPANAAAIVHIPQGVLSTCAAVVSGSRKRYDTTLTLKRDTREQYGLVIVAKSRDGTSKVLSLTGTKPVYVVNIPASMLNPSTSTTSGGAQHFLAYYDLVRLDTARCGEQSFKSPSTATTTRCPVTDLAMTGESGAVQISGMIVDSNCSNSTWP